MRLFALVLVVPAAASLPPAGAHPVSLIDIHMVSSNDGWALSAHGMLRTSDGGRGWVNVHVPGPRSSFLDTAFSAVDGATAWVLSPVRTSTGPSESVVLFTRNGGKSWQRSNVLRGWAAGGADFSWISRWQGWLLTGEGAAAGNAPTNIYRTTDGGAHWRLISYNHLSASTPPGALTSCDGFSGIAFRSTSTGWATGACGPAPQVIMLYRTQDGGATWHQQQLTPPRLGQLPAWNVMTPVFSGLRGTLPVFTTPGRDLTLYRTRDGGDTWRAATPLRVATMEPGSVFALDPGHVWAWDRTTLYGTGDGGRTWRVLSHHLLVPRVLHLQFVSPHIGFAIGAVGDMQPRYLVTTSDGGRTWRRMTTSTTLPWWQATCETRELLSLLAVWRR